MKRLIITRHAQAVTTVEVPDDFHRELTQYGFSQAKEFAKQFQQSGFVPDIVITSPAVRAAQTTKTMVDEWGLRYERVTDQEVIYHSAVDTLLQMIHMLEKEFETVMIVGHNPDLTTLAQYLCFDFRETMTTASSVVLEFSVKDW